MLIRRMAGISRLRAWKPHDPPELLNQDGRPFGLLEGAEGMESTALSKLWSFLILSVNAVIMICVRNCRISFTLIVLFPPALVVC
jgi:hypothetical protein